MTDGEIVGHVPRWISAACASCSITGQFGVKLQEIGSLFKWQGRLEVLCDFIFDGENHYLIFMVCDIPTKSTKICTPRKLLPLQKLALQGKEV